MAKHEIQNSKYKAARRALDYVRDGMTLGLGSGSTAAHFVDLLGEQADEARGMDMSAADKGEDDVRLRRSQGGEGAGGDGCRGGGLEEGSPREVGSHSLRGANGGRLTTGVCLWGERSRMSGWRQGGGAGQRFSG